jgi:hypothetical protein
METFIGSKLYKLKHQTKNVCLDGKEVTEYKMYNIVIVKEN